MTKRKCTNLIISLIFFIKKSSIIFWSIINSGGPSLKRLVGMVDLHEGGVGRTDLCSGVHSCQNLSSLDYLVDGIPRRDNNKDLDDPPDPPTRPPRQGTPPSTRSTPVFSRDAKLPPSGRIMCEDRLLCRCHHGRCRALPPPPPSSSG